MTNEELTAEVAQLEQYLLNVWQWDNLYAIALDRQGLALSLEPYEPNYRTEANAIAAQLNRLLSDRLADAISEADNVLSTLPAGPVRAALVAGLLDRLRGLQQPRACWRQWTEQDPQRYAEQQEAEEHEEVPTPADAWAGVEGDVHRYVAQLVEHIEGHSAEVEQAAATERILWTGSGAQLADLFQRLHAKSWIELPQFRGRPNFTAMARVLYRAFDIRDGDEPMKEGSFTQVCKPSGDNDRKASDKGFAFQIKPRQS